MSLIKILLGMYGVLMILGGVMGYIKAGSKESLLAGVLSGIVILIGIYVSLSNHQLGFGIISLTTALLTVVFIIRFLKTKSFMPAGMLLILTLVALILALSQLFKK